MDPSTRLPLGPQWDRASAPTGYNSAFVGFIVWIVY